MFSHYSSWSVVASSYYNTMAHIASSSLNVILFSYFLLIFSLHYWFYILHGLWSRRRIRSRTMTHITYLFHLHFLFVFFLIMIILFLYFLFLICSGQWSRRRIRSSTMAHITFSLLYFLFFCYVYSSFWVQLHTLHILRYNATYILVDHTSV